MPTTKKPLKRYSILDRCFSNTGRNYTFEGLREAVNEWMLEKNPQSSGISIRQLRDDIAFMKSSDGWEAPIITIPGDGKKRYYRYEDPSFSISKRPVNETQVEELKMLVDALDAFEGLPQFPGLEDLIVKLQSDMEMAQKPNQSKIIDWGNNEFYKGKEYLGPLYRAVSQRKQIKMTYTPFGMEPRTFITNPVYLKQYNNRWFLIALLEKDGFVFINAFDRIDNLVVLDTMIPEDITFDAEEYFDPIVGVSRPMDGEIEEIEIQLTPETYPYVKTKPIHHSQKNYDDECKVKITVIRNRELVNELLKYGWGD
jgi:predicted DNA-binding transcriptional regulator YafY